MKNKIKEIFEKLDELKFIARKYKKLKDGSYDLVSINVEIEEKVEQLKSEIQQKIKKLEESRNQLLKQLSMHDDYRVLKGLQKKIKKLEEENESLNAGIMEARLELKQKAEYYKTFKDEIEQLKKQLKDIKFFDIRHMKPDEIDEFIQRLRCRVISYEDLENSIPVKDVKEIIDTEISNFNKKENYALNGTKKVCCQVTLMGLKEKVIKE